MTVQEKNRDIKFLYAISDQVMTMYRIITWITLSKGPCLSNEIVKGWVCNVAHNPRQDVDDQQGNQCSAYGKTAQHFVEVDINCNTIQSV